MVELIHNLFDYDIFRSSIRLNRKHQQMLIIALLAASFVLYSCSQPDGSVGSSLGPEPGGQTRVGVFNVDRDTSFAISEVKTGGSAFVYVGEVEGIKAEGLYKFYRPIMPISWTLDTAWVSLAFQSGIGATFSMDVEGGIIDYAWKESNPPVLGDVPAAAPENRFIVCADTDTLVVHYPVPASWAEQWLRWNNTLSDEDTVWTDTLRADSSLTLHLTPVAAAPERLARFCARSVTTDSLKPKIYLILTVEDTATRETSADTVIAYAAGDVFLVENHVVLTGGDILIGSGATIQTNLRFDLSSLYQQYDSLRFAVNRAVLTLFRNRTYPTILPPTTAIWPFLLADSLGLNNPEDAEETSYTYVTTAIDTTLDSVQVVVTSPASSWLRDSEKNFGLALHSGSEALDIDRMAFYGPTTDAPAMRPRLTIYYTELPR